MVIVVVGIKIKSGRRLMPKSVRAGRLTAAAELGQGTNPLARERAARGAEQAATVVLSN